MSSELVLVLDGGDFSQFAVDGFGVVVAVVGECFVHVF